MFKFVIGAFTAVSSFACAQFLSYQEQIANACNIAMAVGMATPAGPWIVGGCSTEAAIAKLAQDPSSLEWLNSMLAGLKFG